MNSTLGRRVSTASQLKAGPVTVFILIILTLALMFSAAPIGAHSVYGRNSTDVSETYQSDAEGGPAQPIHEVKAPNVGFMALKQMQRAATTQPVFLWWPLGAIGLALVFGAAEVRQLIKRIQEN